MCPIFKKKDVHFFTQFLTRNHLTNGNYTSAEMMFVNFSFSKNNYYFTLIRQKNMTAMYNYWFWVADPLYIFSCEIVKLIR